MALKVTVGDLRHRVTIQATTAVQDSSGSYPESWSDVATVWARMRPISGREFFAAEQAQSEVTHEVTIRFRRGISPANRLLFDGRVFDIGAVINADERNEWMILYCTERTT